MGEDTQEKLKQSKSIIRQIIWTVFFALLLVFIVRTFFFQICYIPTASMEPSLQKGDRLITNKLAYLFSKPERGDIIVFKSNIRENTDYAKRIIALAGETIQIIKGRVYINNRLLEEDYVTHWDKFSYDKIKIPHNCYYVLGDNRANSIDSRVWGMVLNSKVKGKIIFRIWPLNRIGVLTPSNSPLSGGE